MFAESPKAARAVTLIAKPANPPKATPPLVTASPVDEDGAPKPFLTKEDVKGWTSSLAIHAVFLLILAFWYFAPKADAPRPIHSRLMGSEMGVDEGLTETGGLNTELTIEPAPVPTAPDPLPAVIKPIDLPTPEPKIVARPKGSDKPSADGGLDTINPGAGNGDGFGLARFGDGGETIRGVEVKVGDPQFTLLWDNDADLDLHVIEPGGKEIFWEDPKGKAGLGGELDVDNTKGFGPENIYWLHDDGPDGGKVKGAGPPGEYKWFVVYWGGFGGIPKPTKWKVRIKHNGKVTVVNGKFRALNERSKIYTLNVKPADVGPAASQ